MKHQSFEADGIADVLECAILAGQETLEKEDVCVEQFNDFLKALVRQLFLHDVRHWHEWDRRSPEEFQKKWTQYINDLEKLMGAQQAEIYLEAITPDNIH